MSKIHVIEKYDLKIDLRFKVPSFNPLFTTKSKVQLGVDV